MDSGESRFGTYLKELIKTAGMTQFQFYTELGIKKPYFYDIVSGRVKPSRSSTVCGSKNTPYRRRNKGKVF